MEGEHLAGVCGLYCGACTLYRALRDQNQERLEKLAKNMSERWGMSTDEMQCDGCLSGGKLMPYCQQCKISLCAEEKPGVTRCSDCPDFPCSLITNFNNDGVAHHGAVFENIRRQQKVGVEEWLQEEYERMRCQFCGVSLDWYAKVCHRCGTTEPLTIPSMVKKGGRIQPYYYRG